MDNISQKQVVIYPSYNGSLLAIGWVANHIRSIEQGVRSMSEVKSNFFKTPNEILSLEIPFAPLMVLLYLLTWQNSKKGCFSKHQTIAEKTNLSVSSVQRAIIWLTKKAYIYTYSGKAEKTTNLYKVNYAKIDPKCVNTVDENYLRDTEVNRENVNRPTKKELEIRAKMSQNN